MDASKLCECGCGNPAPLAKRSRPYMGHVKGEPIRFINGHNPQQYQHTAEGFWDRVHIRLDQSICWEWTGPTNDHGHGLLYFKGRTVGAHRLAYTFANGPIGDGLLVRHKCDNPACCNPSHLELGTTQDNTSDRQERGRQCRGERVTGSKLLPSDVVQIRERLRQGESQSAIARSYHLTPSSISAIARGQTWRHLG